MNTVYKQARRHLKMTQRLKVNLLQKSLIVVGIFAVTLYTVLFTTTPLVHDIFHHFRHSLMMIPCH